MGTTQSVVARIESGRGTPSLRTVQLFASAITLPRSNPQGEIGFLSDTRRMNVGMTRTAQAVAGGRFVHAVLASVSCEVVGLCESGRVCRSTREMRK